MKFGDLLTQLGHPVAFHPALNAITGGNDATILLCQLVYWTGKERAGDGWIYKTAADIMAETGLTDWAQRKARRTLVQKGFVKEKVQGIPATVHYQVQLDSVNSAWEKHQSSLSEANELDGSQFGEGQRTSSSEANELDRRRPTNLNAKTTAETTSQTTRSSSSSSCAPLFSGAPEMNEEELIIFRSKSDSPEPPFDDIVALWNKAAKFFGFNPMLNITVTRREILITRWKDEFWRKNWYRALRRIKDQPFLTGRGQKKWKINFDWFIEDGSVEKIVEGAFKKHTGEE